MKSRMSPGKYFSALSPVKTVIGVPGKVVYLQYSTVYCACRAHLPFVSVYIPCLERASHSALRLCC